MAGAAEMVEVKNKQTTTLVYLELTHPHYSNYSSSKKRLNVDHKSNTQKQLNLHKQDYLVVAVPGQHAGCYTPLMCSITLVETPGIFCQEWESGAQWWTHIQSFGNLHIKTDERQRTQLCTKRIAQLQLFPVFPWTLRQREDTANMTRISCALSWLYHSEKQHLHLICKVRLLWPFFTTQKDIMRIKPEISGYNYKWMWVKVREGFRVEIRSWGV